MSRNARQYEARPTFAPGQYVDNRIHSDQRIFEEEVEKVLKKTWKFVCHESELPNAYNFRTTNLAGQSIIVIRGKDGKIRSFLNACPHRGSVIARQPRGTAKRLTCMFHLWSFDYKGECQSITRPEGYAACGLDKESVGLREVRTETTLGLVFANLDDDCVPLQEYLKGALENANSVLEAEPFEVFHYHSAVIKANWKLWHETNVDLYHEWMHAVNRQTGIRAEGYFDRNFINYGNGHLSMDPFRVAYENYPGWSARNENELPSLTPGEFRFIDLFPNTTIVLRATNIRIDTSTPISPTETLVEWRGIAPKSDTDEVREMRIQHHNELWGPFGRNLSEDIIAVEGVQRSINAQSSLYSLHCRDEGGKGQDDGGSRAYYGEWSKYMKRSSSAPF